MFKPPAGTGIADGRHGGPDDQHATAMGRKREWACKPGSVSRSSSRDGRHSSRMTVTGHLKQPTRGRDGPSHVPLYSVLLQAGFTMPPPVTGRRGALLPHPFTLAGGLLPAGGLLSVALSLGSPPPGVTRRPALWSPDFPPASRRMPAAARPTPGRSTHGPTNGPRAVLSHGTAGACPGGNATDRALNELSCQRRHGLVPVQGQAVIFVVAGGGLEPPTHGL